MEKHVVELAWNQIALRILMIVGGVFLYEFYK